MCISFIHIPTFFDGGRSQRIFNLINKEPAFAQLVEHPLLMPIVEDQLGRDFRIKERDRYEAWRRRGRLLTRDLARELGPEIEVRYEA